MPSAPASAFAPAYCLAYRSLGSCTCTCPCNCACSYPWYHPS